MSSFFHRRFQPRQQLIHVIRQRSLEFTITLRFGMNETEGLCMKHLPLDHWQNLPLQKNVFLPPVPFDPVNRIPHNGMTRMRQVDPDLMGSSCLRRNLKQRKKKPEYLSLPPGRHRLFTACQGHGHLFSSLWMTGDGKIDLPMMPLDDPMYQGQVTFFYATRFKLFRQEMMSLISFCHHQDTRRILVQPVNDPGP